VNEQAGFGAPAFGADVSLEEYLALCPPDAETRGMFFESVQKLVETELRRTDDALYAGITTRRWVPFKTYPLTDFLKLAHNATRIAFPRLAQGEALRRIGWQCYTSFASSLAGRVALFAFGQKLDDLVASLPRSYALGLPGSRVKVHRLGETHARVELREVYSFAGTYHVGVIEGPTRASGRTRLQILTRPLERSCDVDLDLQWAKPAAKK
jgi:uncharacterized protein (TIGR02265 family)